MEDPVGSAACPVCGQPRDAHTPEQDEACDLEAMEQNEMAESWGAER